MGKSGRRMTDFAVSFNTGVFTQFGEKNGA